MSCLNPASLRICAGEAGCEEMTSDPAAVTESADTNGRLCTSLSQEEYGHKKKQLDEFGIKISIPCCEG